MPRRVNLRAFHPCDTRSDCKPRLNSSRHGGQARVGYRKVLVADLPWNPCSSASVHGTSVGCGPCVPCTTPGLARARRSNRKLILHASSGSLACTLPCPNLRRSPHVANPPGHSLLAAEPTPPPERPPLVKHLHSHGKTWLEEDGHSFWLESAPVDAISTSQSPACPIWSSIWPIPHTNGLAKLE